MKPMDPAALAAAETVEHEITLEADTGSLTALAPTAGPAEIELFGVVGIDFTARDVRRALTAVAGRDLVVRVNSIGGLVTEGFAIFNAIARHEGRKVIAIEGQACSSAAFIAMAGDEIVMPQASLMMIHNASGGAHGNTETMESVLAVLRKIDGIQADVFAARTGQDRARVAELLAAETYFTAEEAVSLGFADRIENREAVQAAALVNLEDIMARAGGQSVAFRTAPTAHITAQGPATPPAPPAPATPPTGAAPPTPPAPAAPPASQPTAVATIQDLRAMVTQARGAVSADWALDLAAEGVTVAEARSRLIDAMAARQPQRPEGGIQITQDERDTFRGALEDALMYRMGGGQPTERARPLLGRSAMELARASIEAAGGKPAKFGHDTLRLAGAAMNLSSDFRAEAGMHTTSDFPVVLGNAARRTLLGAYAQVPQNWRQISQPENFEDFRKKQFLKLSGTPQLERIGEHGEFKYGTLSEGAEGFGIDTWGKIFAFTRQLLINDDLGALARAMRERGSSAGRTISARVWALVNNGHIGTGANKVIMSDGKAVFHADHKNLAASGTDITDAAMEAAYLAFAQQVDENGEPIDITPRTLVVGPTRAATARKFLGTGPNASGVPNIYQGDLQLIVEPRITTNAWFLFADPPLRDGLAVGFLNGREEPRLEEKAGWNVEGVEFKVALDFDAGWLDYRVAYRNPGN
ncbi:head maturation protease, ClpP-related [Roseomonas populi]|uniref:ATP-dependent Clp protease proteolytic subunit n=1 Tax=Roseomonas populi TaxID=3121582 RepID=A0ABT1X3N4_9PROT|nr:head maturation protease, ClpP-related [Roseomonas pecuniae]MCR0981797.1 ATP-dependent Clp protease proteolytic subunit [Roseomonas pecuniae]